MTITSLYSGIGGFELAFARVGVHTNLLVEIDPAARKVLEARFPGVEIQSNVEHLKGIPAKTSLLTAGFPCQNLSMAGDKSGIMGPKSGTVAHLFQLIDRSGVPSVLIENVYFMLQLDAGRAMQWLAERFEDLKYKWAYRVLDTMGFGLPQRRRRVYFLASKEFDPRAVLFSEETSPEQAPDPDLNKPLGFYWTEGRSGLGLTVDGIPPLKVGSALGIPSAPSVLFPDGQVLMPSVGACEQLQGFPKAWTAIEFEEKVALERIRWRLVGNAVSVPVAEWVARRFLQPGHVLDLPTMPLSLSSRSKWPDAAWNTGEGRMMVRATDRPILVPRPSISAFRDSTWTHLSERALGGFIRRASEGRLSMPPGFLDALRGAQRKLAA